MLKSPLLSTFITLVLVKGLNFLIPILTTPFLTRTLGIDAYGELMTMYTLAQYFIILCDFGIEFYGAREIAIIKPNKEKNLIFKIYLLKLILFIASLVIFPLISHTTNLSINASFLILILGNTILPNWLMLGKNKIKKFSLFFSMSKFISLCLIFIFIKNASDAYLFPLFDGLALVILSIIILFNYFQIQKVSIYEMKHLVKNSVPLFFSKVSISLYTITNPLIIAYYLGHKEVGYFVGLTKLIDIPVSLLNPINQTLFNSSVKKHQNNIDINYLKKVLIIIPFTFLLGSIMLYFLFNYIVGIYLGAIFKEFAKNYSFIAITPFIISISSILGFQYFLASGRRKEFSTITMIGSIVSILLCSLGTKHFGIKGTLISYLIIETLISLMMLITFIIEARKTSQLLHQ